MDKINKEISKLTQEIYEIGQKKGKFDEAQRLKKIFLNNYKLKQFFSEKTLNELAQIIFK